MKKILIHYDTEDDVQEQRGGARTQRNQPEVDGEEEQGGAQREQHEEEPYFEVRRIINPFDGIQRHINVAYIGNRNAESDVHLFLLKLKDELRKHIAEFFQEKYIRAQKIGVNVPLTMMLPDGQTIVIYINIPIQEIFCMENYDDIYTIVKDTFIERIETYQEGGSGQRLVSINGCDIQLLNYQPIRGGTYIVTPEVIQNKKAVINVQTYAHQNCVHYAILSVIYGDQVHRPHKPTSYSHVKEKIKMEGISFPTPLSEMKKIEDQNSIAINVYKVDTRTFGRAFSHEKTEEELYKEEYWRNTKAWLKENTTQTVEDEKEEEDEEEEEEMDKIHLQVLQLSKRKDTETFVNLLMIHQSGEDTNEDDTWHYCGITSLDRLLNTAYGKQKRFCLRCLQGFDVRYEAERKLSAHSIECKKNNPGVRVVYPEDDEVVFDKFWAREKHAIAIYADFESLLSPNVEEKKIGNMENLQVHTPSGVAIRPIIDERLKGKIFHPHLKPAYYTGEDVCKWFWIKMREIAVAMDFVYKHQFHEEDSSTEDWATNQLFRSESECWICKHPITASPKSRAEWMAITKKERKKMSFTDKRGHKVRDHCHWTGEYKGAAHNHCNWSRQHRKQIPVYFHNLTNYDLHYLAQSIHTVSDLKEPSVLAKSSEKWMSLKVGFDDVEHVIKFFDTLNFLPGSLAKLTQNRFQCAKGDISNYFPATNNFFRQHYPDLPSSDINLLLRKGVFPYSHLTHLKVLKQTCLPPKEAFYDVLSDEDISDEDYQHAQAVWKTFRCETLLDYHDLYMVVDVAQLSDIFEGFRRDSIHNYGLDPAYFVSAPGLSWQACLLQTRVRLEILKDPEMSIFIDEAFIGGVSVARNPKLSVKYKEENGKRIKTHHLMLLDCNNQYGHAMSQYLPTGGFAWDTEALKMTEEDIQGMDDRAQRGYYFEVDLEYPQNLHDRDDQYPLAPEHYTIKKEELSEYQHQMAENYNVSMKNTSKLCLTLHNKTRYKLHYTNLKQYISLGMKVKKIHRVLSFNQSLWLSRYIACNTTLRQKAATKHDENLPKLFNNSVFGKTCEDPYKYSQVKLIYGDDAVKRMQRWQNRQTFKAVRLITDHSALAIMKKSCVILDKPRYVGACILSISKAVMYQFHHEFIIHNFPGKVQLLLEKKK